MKRINFALVSYEVNSGSRTHGSHWDLKPKTFEGKELALAKTPRRRSMCFKILKLFQFSKIRDFLHHRGFRVRSWISWFERCHWGCVVQNGTVSNLNLRRYFLLVQFILYCTSPLSYFGFSHPQWSEVRGP